MEKLVFNSLKKLLTALREGRFWYALWSKDWLLKLVSVVIAISLWHVVGREDVVDKNVMVPIEIINLPRDLVIANQFKREIEVTMSGSRGAIEKMGNGSVSRQINLSSAQPGSTVIDNRPDDIPVPRGVTVLRVQPSTLILSIDKLVQKQYRVTPVTKGEVGQGYQLDGLKMEPDIIAITGPSTVLSKVEELRTRIIDISGLKESRQLQIPLDLDAGITELIGDTSVTASIHISVKTVEKIVSGVEVVLLDNGVKQKVNPARVDVLLRVPQTVLRKGTDLRSLISVNASISENGDTAQLIVLPKENGGGTVEVINVFPDTVTLLEPRKTEKMPPGNQDHENENTKPHAGPVQQEKGINAKDNTVPKAATKAPVGGSGKSAVPTSTQPKKKD